MLIINAHEAAALIQDDWVVTTGGFGHCGSPEALLKALQDRHKSTGTPSNLTLFFASGPGDRAQNGLNRLAHPGLVRRIIGGFWSLAPRIGQLALSNEIEAHNWPQGVVSHMFRAIAGGKPGVLTEVGLNTFMDPEQRGGCLNSTSTNTSPLVERLTVAHRPMLLYKSLPIHCALLRGTRADEAGNISMEHEANIQDVLAQAQAVHNSGGIVIVQVQQISTSGALSLAKTRIPGFLVDYVVVADEEDHWQTYGEKLNPAYCGQWQGGMTQAIGRRPNEDPITAKRVISRRAMLELMAAATAQDLRKPLVVNLGIGTPENIAREIHHSQLLSSRLFTLTVESGAVGGIPAGGLSFGATAYPHALLSQAELFDLYDGGGIDIAFLGFGQIDPCGRINVAALDRRLNGVGGFINISQAAKHLVFCGSFTAGELSIEASNDEGLKILREGGIRKMVSQLSHICYDPAGHSRCKQPLVITERGVFRLSAQGLELIELAQGVDLKQDILNQSDIPIRVSTALRPMPATVFATHRLEYPVTS